LNASLGRTVRRRIVPTLTSVATSPFKVIRTFSQRLLGSPGRW